MYEYSIKLDHQSTCALSGFNLASQIDIGVAHLGDMGFGVFVSLFLLLIVSLWDPILEIIFRVICCAFCICRLSSCLWRLVVQHSAMIELEVSMFCLNRVVDGPS